MCFRPIVQDLELFTFKIKKILQIALIITSISLEYFIP